MKKITFAFAILSLIFAASCHKYTDSGGSWIFQGNSYTVSNCEVLGNSLVATSSNNSNVNTFGHVGIIFSGSSFPDTSATYTVVDTTPAAGQVSIVVATGGVLDTTYNVLGTSGNNQINITVAKNGEVTATGTVVRMFNVITSVISNDTLAFNIHTVGKS